MLDPNFIRNLLAFLGSYFLNFLCLGLVAMLFYRQYKLSVAIRFLKKELLLLEKKTSYQGGGLGGVPVLGGESPMSLFYSNNLNGCLKLLLLESTDLEKQKDIRLLLSRLADLTNRQKSNTITEGDYLVELSKIREGILYYL